MKTCLLVLAVCAGPIGAQSPCEGNGLGVTLAVSPAYVGEPMSIDVASPASPGGFGLLSYAGKVGPIDHPLLGPSCLDVFSSLFGVVPLGLDAAGEAHVTLTMPASPELIGAPPIFLSAAAIVGDQIGLAKTVPIWFAQHDAWFPAGTLSAPRGFLQATALGAGPDADRIGVFVSGGGDLSMVEPGSKDDTWVFEPFTRTFAAGPKLTVPRNFHTQTRLADGRILITGGCDASGVVHASAEVYDPATNQIAPVASMTAPRSGHAATLLADGRVLVTGGLADFQDAKTAFAAAMDTAQDTAEIYDPIAGAWTPVPTTMSTTRVGHGQVLWPDGRVLVVSGAKGGTWSTYSGDTAEFTDSVNWFDPSTLRFTFAPALDPGLSNFALGFIAPGQLMLVGGLNTAAFTGGAYATTAVRLFDGTGWQSTGLPQLQGGAAFASLGILPGGSAIVVGGFHSYLTTLHAISSTSLLEQGCAGSWCPLTFLAPIGTSEGIPGSPSLRGGHAMVELFDGTFLVVGGMHGSDATPVGTWALDDAWIYAP